MENSNNTGNTMNSKTYSVPGDERSLLSIYLSFPQYIPNDLVIEEEDFELEDVKVLFREILFILECCSITSKSDMVFELVHNLDDSAYYSDYIRSLLFSEDNVTRGFKIQNAIEITDEHINEIKDEARYYADIVRFNRIRREMESIVRKEKPDAGDKTPKKEAQKSREKESSKKNYPNGQNCDKMEPKSDKTSRMLELWQQLDEIYDRRNWRNHPNFYSGFDRLQNISPQKASVAHINQNLQMNVNTIRNWTKPAFRLKNPNYMPAWKTVFQLLDYFESETQGSLEYLLNGPNYSEKIINYNYKLQLSNDSLDMLVKLNSQKSGFSISYIEMFEILTQLPGFTSGILSSLGKYYDLLLPHSIRSGKDSLEEWIVFKAISAEQRASLRKTIEDSIESLLEKMLKSEQILKKTNTVRRKIYFRRGLLRCMQAKNMRAVELGFRIAESDSTIRSWLQSPIKNKILTDLLKIDPEILLSSIQTSEMEERKAINAMLKQLEYTEPENIRDFIQRYLDGKLLDNEFECVMDVESLFFGISQTIPEVKTLKHLCMLFNVDLDYLLGISDFEWEENRYITKELGFSSEKTVRWFRNLPPMDSNNIEYILENYTYNDNKLLFMEVLANLIRLHYCVRIKKGLPGTPKVLEDINTLHFDIISNCINTYPKHQKYSSPRLIVIQKYENGQYYSQDGCIYSSVCISKQMELLNHIITHLSYSIKEQITELSFEVLDKIDTYLFARDPYDITT